MLHLRFNEESGDTSMFLSQLNYPEKYSEHTPIIVTLHGMGSTYEDLPPVAREVDEDAIFLHIQANLTFGDGFAFFVPDFSHHSEQEVILPVLKNVHDFVEQILKVEGLGNNPLVFLGFSQGAMISLGITYLYPTWLHSAFIFSGRMPAFYQELAETSFDNAKSQTNLFISQGQQDPLFPVTVGRVLSDFAKEKVANVFYQEYPAGHGIHPQAITDAKIFYLKNRKEDF